MMLMRAAVYRDQARAEENQVDAPMPEHRSEGKPELG
jgi:hypothetical protein